MAFKQPKLNTLSMIMIGKQLKLNKFWDFPEIKFD